MMGKLFPIVAALQLASTCDQVGACRHRGPMALGSGQRARTLVS